MFDISRIPLGRVANKAAHFLRGKYKPTYDPKKLRGNGDMVVIVGADNIKMTGMEEQLGVLIGYWDEESAAGKDPAILPNRQKQSTSH